MFNGREVACGDFLNPELFRTGAMFADVEQLLERAGIQSETGRQSLHRLAPGGRNGLSLGDDGMAEKGCEGRERAQDQVAGALFVACLLVVPGSPECCTGAATVLQRGLPEGLR